MSDGEFNSNKGMTRSSNINFEKKEESLSDKEEEINHEDGNIYKKMYWEHNVKKSIRLLKEEFRQNTNYETIITNEIIDKIFGPKLI